jgi:hypothetical protein
MRKYMGLIILVFMLAAAGCSDFGQVDQGRVVAYDKEQKTIVIVRDISPDTKKPDYTGLPPVTYALPKDSHETGPAPAVGKLLKVDLENKKAAIFVESSSTVQTVDLEIVEQRKADAKDPLVFDASTKKIREFPIIDQQAKTIEIYLEKMKTLLTFSVPEQYSAMPPDTWKMGDEVRIYYKEPGKALRFMNVSKTDIFKK